MKILAVDLGRARTGLAVCDESELLASPAGVINEHNMERLAQTIAAQAAERAVGTIVVGLPRNMDGSEGESAQNARAFAEALRALVNVPVEMRDERGTTITAHGYLNDTDTRGKKRKAVVDAVAATIILQDYLDYRRNQRGQKKEGDG
ncbi:Holliday junction resolvase RuvX [Caproiciproducens sp. R1]|jgi:RNAse H-fold protein YqgF|uniref:Holliday junction resolvase RuvX n=1 Tax=Caproiciproducens sp. R1 TaxID=3435000 RepID=UPI00056E1A02